MRQPGFFVSVRRTTSRRVDDITLGSDPSVMPRQELINTINPMVRNSREGISQPCLRVNAVEFGRLDQGIGDGSRFAATLRSHKQIVFAFKGYRSHGSFGGVVIKF